MRIMTRIFSVAYRKDKPKLKSLMHAMLSVYRGEGALQYNLNDAIYNLQVDCPALDFVLSQEIKGYEQHTKKNKKIEKIVDAVAKVITTATTLGATGAAGAFGGPAAGKAAGEIAEVVNSLVAGAISGLLKHDNAVYEFRRNLRSAWIGSYQSLLLDSEGKYYNNTVCSALAQHVMHLASWFINLDAEKQASYQDKINLCAEEPVHWFNNYDRFQPLLTVIARRIGLEYSSPDLRSRLKEIKAELGDVGAEVVGKVWDMVKPSDKDKF